MSLEEINDFVHQETKRFWIDQFKPFEEKGFTKEMIDGAKSFYHSKEWINN